MSTKEQRAAEKREQARRNSYFRFQRRVSGSGDPMVRLQAAHDFLTSYLARAERRDRQTVAEEAAKIAQRAAKGQHSRSRAWANQGLRKTNTPELRLSTAYRLLLAHLKRAEPADRRAAAKALTSLAEKVAKSR